MSKEILGPLSLTGDIIAFENGELEEEEVIQLFQGLVDTGLAWQLQGSYGRTAMDLINAGLVHPVGRTRCESKSNSESE